MRILVLVGCRSDASLSEPIITRLQKDQFFNCFDIHLKASDYIESYRITEHYIQLLKPDLVFCTGDRIEMCAASSAAYHNNTKTSHFYAGVITEGTTLDAINRHIITLRADITFTESSEASFIVNKLWETIEKHSNHIYTVGMSHLDDVELDTSLVPDEPYNLVLYNPNKNTPNELKELRNAVKDFCVIIGGNPDPYKNPIQKWILQKKIKDYEYFDNLPKEQYLGLVSKCSKFYSNSSDIHYTIPHLLKPEQVIQIGKRNSERSSQFTKIKTGASQKIVDILKKWWQNETLV